MISHFPTFIYTNVPFFSDLINNIGFQILLFLFKASIGRTTIIVAHRLSTIRNADKIVVISGGQVVEQGTHDDLIKLKGHYFGLVMAQVSTTGDLSSEEGNHIFCKYCC